MSEFRLYWRYLRLHILSGVQYKGWFLMVLAVVFTVVTDPVGTVILFSRFGNVGPWSVERMLLMFSMAITSFGLAETFARGFDYFPGTVQSGEFDRVLLRPRSTFPQVAASYFHIHRLARVFSGLAAVIWCLWRMEVPMGPANIALLLYALLGGLVLYTGVFVLTSGVAIFTIKALDWIYIFTNASYQVTRCPIDYMPPWMRSGFTFIMPVLLVAYYPASVICGWGEPLWKGLLALPAGLAMLGLGLIMWRIGRGHYASTGS